MNNELKSEADGVLAVAGGLAAFLAVFEASSASDWLRRVGHGAVIGLVIIYLAMRYVYQRNDDV